MPWVADLPPISPSTANKQDQAFRNRWRTLLSVDDLVAGVVEALASVSTRILG